jgi:amino acid permease
MEKEELSQKFQVELKWGSYYFIYSIVLSFLFSFLSFFFLSNNNTSNLFIIFLNIILLFYFSIKCIKEKKTIKNITFKLKLLIISSIFIINYLFISLLFTNYNQFIIPKRELEISESKESLNKIENNILNNLLTFIKRKFKN